MNRALAEVPLEARLPPEDFPPGDDVVLVTRFDEALEILRSPHMMPGQGTRTSRVAIDRDGTVRFADAATDGRAEDDPATEVVPWDSIFRRGALSYIHGTTHTQRRRALNPLFGHDAHVWFRDKVVMPTLARNLAGLVGDADGITRADMAVFSKRVFVQVTAALVGFDEAQTDVGSDRLVQIQSRMEYGRHLANVLPNGAERRQHMQAALDARATLFEQFYLPSLESRRELVARYQAGELVETELPHDFLMLVAEGAATFEDPQVGFAVALQLAQGSIGTNTSILLHGLADLASWFGLHPEDYARRTDPTFLECALTETIRLHSPGTGTFSRVALEDVALSTGRVILKGQYAALFREFINRDQAVFGPDADSFNPGRVVPTGVYPFGLGFGSGSHMCIGLPLVMGQGGISGMQVPAVQALHAAGIGPDPDRPAEKFIEFVPYRIEYATFPVIFNRRG